ISGNRSRREVSGTGKAIRILGLSSWLSGAGGVCPQCGKADQKPSRDHQQASDRSDGAHRRKAQQGDRCKGEAEDQTAGSGQPAGRRDQAAPGGPGGADQGDHRMHQLVMGAGGQQLLDLWPGAVGGEGADGHGQRAVQRREPRQTAIDCHSATLADRIPRVCYSPAMTAAQRMALQYVLLFGATGVSLPFAGLWMRSQGLSGAEIGALLAAPMLARVVTGPLLAVWADGFRYRRTPIALLGLVMAAGYGLAGGTDVPALRALGWFIGATAMAGLVPLTDVMPRRLAGRLGFSFSLPRGAGSAAFVVANVGMGALLLSWPADAVIVWLVAVSLGLAAVAVLALPPERVAEGAPVAGLERFRGLGRLVVDPVFMLAIFAIGVVQAAHAFQYGFSALLW